MKITFEPAARDELDYIFRWIARDNPRAASEIVARIEAKVMRLAAPNLAHMGRPGFVEGTRELIEYPTNAVPLDPSCPGLTRASIKKSAFDSR